jgi:hypothetical protein
MTDYPLSTLAASVTATGISAPPLEDILGSLQASYRSIYGSDAYLEPDSQDGQWIAILATAFNDCNNVAIAVYNAFSPSSAQGTGLSSIVKINGLRRRVATYSTVSVLIVGAPGTIINNGIVEDVNEGNQFTLPAIVTIPAEGQITVTATAAVLGDIDAQVGAVTRIITPTRGWQTVNNVLAATPGVAVETDAALRRRQEVSTSVAAQTVLEGIVGAVSNLSGVTALAPYENDTNVENALGIPPHSIALVVQGGTVQEIADTIAAKKAPGTGTYGTTSTLVFDSLGVPSTVNYFEPTQVPVEIAITIKALVGYVSTTGTRLVSEVVSYVDNLGIGAGDREGEGKVFFGKVWAIASLTGSGLERTYNITSVTLSRDGDPLSAVDIAIAFNEIATCETANVTLTVV